MKTLKKRHEPAPDLPIPQRPDTEKQRKDHLRKDPGHDDA